MKKKSLPVLGSRSPSYVEFKGEHVVIINEITEHKGQQWNTPVGEIRLPTQDLARQVMGWIR